MTESSGNVDPGTAAETARTTSSLLSAGRDEILPLSDGRKLSVRHFGDEDGVAVAFFHGWPGSRLEAGLGHDDAAAAGVHLIGFDRPGFGLSDHKRGRTLSSWPADVAEGMSLMRIDKFSVIGISGGGPFALACAAKIPERLIGAASVCGIAPPEAPGIPKAFKRNMVIFKIGRYVRPLPHLLLRMMIRKQRKQPNDMMEYLLPRVPPSDRVILERPEMAEALTADQAEAYRGGTNGPVLESRLFVTPWDFRPEDITMPVHIWQGTADIQVTVESVRYLLGKLQHGVGHFIDGGGHYFIADRFPEVLASVTTRS
jgi:pimeloyl-ACP methyl ester carboxylesterase